MTRRQQYATATAIVVLLLIAFLWYYFRQRKLQKAEKCPDGSPIPSSGDCTKIDSSGAVIVVPEVPDASGCIPPNKYITNAFPLVLGMKGEFVRKVQAQLNFEFKANLKEDGYMGCNTVNAMKKAWNIETMDLEFFNNNIQQPLTT